MIAHEGGLLLFGRGEGELRLDALHSRRRILRPDDVSSPRPGGRLGYRPARTEHRQQRLFSTAVCFQPL
ncbi:MAG: hypothetical protein WBA12_00730 [Catalinimonas sp.]